MTPEAQRIAIAEACGWVAFAEHKNPDFFYAPGERCKELCRTHRLPDYLNDLNAMHEAEKVLGDEQRKQYAELLLPMMGEPEWSYNDVFATAGQRAEAFLRTLSLWDDTK